MKRLKTLLLDGCVYCLIGTISVHWCSLCSGGTLLNAHPGPARAHGRRKSMQEKPMHNPFIHPLIALIAGILILVMPRLLNYIVALYLIIIGILGLAPHLLR